jgi:hypothetical protein
MSVEAIAAVVSFVGLFFAWVIVPSVLRKHHTTKGEDNVLD